MARITGNSLKSKKIWLSLTLAVILGTAGFFIEKNATQLKKVSIIADGMQVCFTRVYQTFTGSLLTGTGQYTSSNFMNVTEECFVDTVTSLEDNIKNTISNNLKSLNTLASNVHWFHEKVLNGRNVNLIEKGDFVAEINQRFSKIENLKNEALDNIDSIRTEISSDISLLMIGLVIAGIFLPILLLFEILDRGVSRAKNKLLEKDAIKIINEDEIDYRKTETIVTSALENNDLNYCAHLFTNFCTDVFEGKISANGKNINLEERDFPPIMLPSSKVKKVTGKDAFKKREQSKTTISAAQPVKKEKAVADNISDSVTSSNLDNSLTNTLELLSSELLTNGIAVDVNISNKLNVEIRGESLEQIFFQLINNSIKFNSDSEKSIVFAAITDDNNTVISVTDNGQGFSSDFLATEAGLDQKSAKGVGLSICEALLNEFQGHLRFLNVKQDGRVVGARVEFSLRSIVANKNAQLVSLFKGKKKDFVKSIDTLM